jgi:hypothetical protein
MCRFHVASGTGSVPCQKPVSIRLQKCFLFPTGRLNLGFILRKNLLLCSSYLPLGVPNWSSTLATNKRQRGESAMVAAMWELVDGDVMEVEDNNDDD